MIKIIVKYRSYPNEISSISATGHADSGEYGHDLVCAGVSTVMVGLANALDEKNGKGFEISINEGNASITHRADQAYEHDYAVIFETALTMLKTIQISNSQFVEIVEKN